MPDAAATLQKFVWNFKDWWDEYMVDFAEVVENVARSHKEWLDDSGSADEAITAYVVGRQDHTKNYGGERWRAARAVGYESPRWRNPSENFMPYEQVRIALAEKAVILTHFVKYGYDLERNIRRPLPRQLPGYQQGGQNQGDTFKNTFAVTADDFVKACANALTDAFEKAGMVRRG